MLFFAAFAAEYAQSYTDYRAVELKDLIANLLGIITVYLITKREIRMKNLFTILLIALVAFTSEAEVCTITLTGDWTNSSLRIVEPNSGVDTTITSTSNVYFRGTGNATFLYMGTDGVNTFEYLNCAGYDFTSPILTDKDLYISAGALPVELSYFKAELLNETGVLLSWQTASEENNQGFEVQKSTNGKDFETLDFVEGNGTTLETQNYSFTDSELENGTAYYRLKQLDFDGQFEYSKIITINIQVENRLNFGNIITNSIQFQEPVLYAELYDINGRLLNHFSNVQSIETSGLKSGMYFLRIGNQTYKLIK